MVVSLSLQGTLSNADCASDCRTALSAADRLIQDLREEVTLQHSIVTTQQESIVTLTLQNEEKAEQLSSAFRNPFIVGGVCISLGITLGFILHK